MAPADRKLDWRIIPGSLTLGYSQNADLTTISVLGLVLSLFCHKIQRRIGSDHESGAAS